MTPVEVTEGTGPLVLGLAHTGTYLPPAIGAALNMEGRVLRDTDWHIESLYNGLAPDVTVVRATHHRYVIDVNRDPAGNSLYPGQTTTGLVPLTDFDSFALWDTPPDAAEVSRRIAAFHAPYHAALAAQMARVQALHGVAILYDCHSIRSEIPFLFNGTLPDFNIGTFDGATCDPRLTAVVIARLAEQSHVVNGRFKGGWTTRHYGRPPQGWHAIQMELAQSGYLVAELPPWRPDPIKWGRMRSLLATILNDIITLAPALKVTP